jgi:hypothetical protein
MQKEAEERDKNCIYDNEGNLIMKINMQNVNPLYANELLE